MALCWRMRNRSPSSPAGDGSGSCICERSALIDRIVAQGCAPLRDIEALGATEPSGHQAAARRQERIMEEHRDERYWSRFARSYDRDGEYVVGRPILDEIERRLLEERCLGDVIELGCGTGYFTGAIARNASHVIATDLSDEMLQVARARLGEFENVTVQKADCMDVAFPAQRFDSVFMANLIHVIDNPARCLQESYRVLRDGGSLIVVDFTAYRMRLSRKVKLVFRYLRTWGLPPHHGRDDVSPDGLVCLVKGAGFRVEDVQLMQDGSNAVYLKGRKE